MYYYIVDSEILKIQSMIFSISRANVASVGSVFNDTRKVKVLSLLIFPLSFQEVREPLPFAYFPYLH